MVENLLAIGATLADPRLFFILAAMASFRLSEMVAIDDGPFDVFFELRSWANDSPLNNRSLKRTFHNAIACVHCAGIYFAIFIVIGYLAAPNIAALIIFPLAIAGLQSIISNRFGRQAK